MWLNPRKPEIRARWRNDFGRNHAPTGRGQEQQPCATCGYQSSISRDANLHHAPLSPHTFFCCSTCHRPKERAVARNAEASCFNLSNKRPSPCHAFACRCIQNNSGPNYVRVTGVNLHAHVKCAPSFRRHRCGLPQGDFTCGHVQQATQSNKDQGFSRPRS